MQGNPKFSVPGHDGELPPGTNIWRKGMVYTTRSPGSLVVTRGYRVAAGIKCGRGSWSSQPGLSKLYHRVKAIAAGVIAGKTSLPGERDHHEPTEEALLSPGGASLGELALLSPQSADEIYNEFDFTGPGDHHPITLSYGEPVSGPAVDFEPVVQRAGQMAAHYHSILSSLGEVYSGSLQVTRREWFLANEDFATVHICFER